MKRLHVHFFSWALLLALPIILSASSQAATITVDTLADDSTTNGNCTFREAIVAANTDTAQDACPAGSGADVIQLAVAGTIQLTADLPPVTKSLSILGPGPDHLEIRGDISGVQNYKLLDLRGSASLPQTTYLVRGISLNGGAATQNGGGVEIVNPSVTTLEFVDIKNCFAGASGAGVSVRNVVIPTPTLASRLTIRWSSIEFNLALLGGGGISIEGITEVNIENSTVAFNETLDNSSPGGGILIASGGLMDATVRIRHSTISANTTNATTGGGVYARTLDNLPMSTQAISIETAHSTITNNSAAGFDPSFQNEGGGFYLFGEDVTATFENNVIANNAVPGGQSTNEDIATPVLNDHAVVVTNGYNFIGEANPNAGFPPGNPNANSDYALAGGIPGLQPLGDYGGPTKTAPPTDSSSPLVDQGSCSGEPFDQRGFGFKALARRRVDLATVSNADDGCDIGAVELIGGGQDVGPIADYDADSVPDENDNCIFISNLGQENLDGDALGNACDPDVDNDGLWNPADPDDDNDGMTDDHEQTYAILDPYDPSDAGSDPDGDNLTSLEEFNIDPNLDPDDPDTDDDLVDDFFDNAPLISNNACSGANALFSGTVTSIVVCGASGSIEVGSPALVQSSGTLALVSPSVIATSISIEGELSVFNADPCAACP